jgi:glutamate-ammonia-ligase adenylyltransferase
MDPLAGALVAGEAGADALARAGVADPDAFAARWAALAAGLDGAKSTPLAAALLGAARPDAALDAWTALAADPESGADPAAPGAPALARVLGGADFLARRAARMPDVVAEVCAAPELAPRTAEAAHARLSDLDDSGRLDHAGRDLRRNRYREMFRLTARALAGAPGHETTRELSDLADASLAAGLRAVEAAHDVSDRLVIFAMGKLGGRELNYSSDVDLLFVHGDADADETRIRQLSRSVTSLRSLLSEISEEGFVFRVDLDLRPEGRTGPLVNSADALVDFYESFGRTWERVAWIRARPCAGDRDLGDRVLRELQPFVYRRYGSYDVIQNVRGVKQRIEADARDARRNVKLGPGGIREAEFVVQGLQVLYGGRHEALRTQNTTAALTGLAELGILEGEIAEHLIADYDLLRRVENAIQMAEDRQTQDLPEDPIERLRLARRLGRDDPDGEAAVAGLQRDLDGARERVSEAFESLLVEREVRVGDRSPEAARWAAACAAPGPFVAALMEAAAPPAVERARPAAQRLAQAAFGAGGDGAAVLARAPDAAPALALFLAADPELVNHLIRHPALLAAFAPAPEGEPIAPAEAPAPDDDLEAGLDRLRKLRRDVSVRAAARTLRGESSEAELEAALSTAAERVLEGGLALARHHDALTRAGDPEPARLCVLALGKLGSMEMTFQSDLDLVFLYEPRDGGEPLVGQEWAARLAHRLIHYLTTPTTAGRAYEVDTRLRPSGHGGALVASLEAFRLYHERRAQIWEAQALLRARPVAGDDAFGEQVMETVRSALFEFLKYPDLEREIVSMRRRIEVELARTGPEWIDLKSGPGGIVDAEFLAQYLALREGPRRPELRGGSTPDLIAAAGRLGLLRDAGDVLGALETLRRAQSSLRLVTGRPESALEVASPVAELVAAIVGAGPRDAWIEGLRVAQERLRAIFRRELRPAD